MSVVLRLDVPPDDLREHREREASFLAAGAAAPLLARIRPVHFVGPQSD